MPKISLSFKTREEWSAENPVLTPHDMAVDAVMVEADGSLTFNIDPRTGRPQANFKIGDGKTAWSSLPYDGEIIVREGQGDSGDCGCSTGLIISAVTDASKSAAAAESAKGQALASKTQAEIARGQARQSAGQAEEAASEAQDFAEMAAEAAQASNYLWPWMAAGGAVRAVTASVRRCLTLLNLKYSGGF
jgi:hypothetical protein